MVPAASGELILISAMTRGRVIGRNNALPWDIPEEYEQFLRRVRGSTVLMGRTSYEIFGRDLRESTLIVVSRSLDRLPAAEIRPSVESAIELARSYGGRIFSAGGATIYRQTLPLADALYLSIVKRDYTGDTHFPEFDPAEWVVVQTEDHPRYEFRVYQRRQRRPR
jgi:dihydrofolate reductase